MVIVSVRAVGSARSRSLNCAFTAARIGPPTCSLSRARARCPMGAASWASSSFARRSSPREARAQGKSVESHWAHMTVHGVLHLLGFDHERDREARKMAAREIQILDRLGFSNPYA